METLGIAMSMAAIIFSLASLCILLQRRRRRRWNEEESAKLEAAIIEAIEDARRGGYQTPPTIEESPTEGNPRLTIVNVAAGTTARRINEKGMEA
jgi:type II secretory pathway pseudopilin PulG